MDDFRFGLTGPPRDLPLLVRARLLTGGFMNQFGWAFFGFGMIFVWVFVAEADLTGWITFGCELETAQGVATGRKETSLHINDSPVYLTRYRFTVDDKQYEGTSYATGRSHEKGEAVTVEFPVGNPSRSRIRGMRTKPMVAWCLFILIFPAVGICCIIPGTRRGLKALRLLKRGIPAEGRLVDKARTTTRINDDWVYRYTFEFSDDGGRTHRAIAKTHLTYLLEDGELEPLLYDPMNPEHAILIDHLPGAPRIDEMGQIRNSGLFATLRSMFLPMVAILGHGTYAIMRFLG